MSETQTVVISPVMRRRLRDQPVLRCSGLWDPSNPESGAGRALAQVNAEVERQGLARAGSVHICVGPPTSEGLVSSEAVVPVDRLGRSVGEVEAVTLPATEAISVLYRDDIHLSSSATVVQQILAYVEQEGLILDGEPRWVYHTSPEWNLEPDDHLIEVLWPLRDPASS